jgi:hypothetical protein
LIIGCTVGAGYLFTRSDHGILAEACSGSGPLAGSGVTPDVSARRPSDPRRRFDVKSAVVIGHVL